MHRRQTLLLLSAGMVGMTSAGSLVFVGSNRGTEGAIAQMTGSSGTLLGLPKSTGEYEIVRTEKEWRDLLTTKEFRILRQEKTERAGSSPLDKLYDAGTYHCAGCDLPVYSSEHKFDSGTGWPSWYQARPDAIRVKEDRSLFGLRTEVHCRRCGGHFGHVFNDGPKPTGLRHCINGIALYFVAA